MGCPAPKITPQKKKLTIGDAIRAERAKKNRILDNPDLVKPSELSNPSSKKTSPREEEVEDADLLEARALLAKVQLNIEKARNSATGIPEPVSKEDESKPKINPESTQASCTSQKEEVKKEEKIESKKAKRDRQKREESVKTTQMYLERYRQRKGIEPTSSKNSSALPSERCSQENEVPSSNITSADEDAIVLCTSPVDLDKLLKGDSNTSEKDDIVIVEESTKVERPARPSPDEHDREIYDLLETCFDDISVGSDDEQPPVAEASERPSYWPDEKYDDVTGIWMEFPQAPKPKPPEPPTPPPKPEIKMKESPAKTISIEPIHIPTEQELKSHFQQISEQIKDRVVPDPSPVGHVPIKPKAEAKKMSKTAIRKAQKQARLERALQLVQAKPKQKQVQKEESSTSSTQKPIQMEAGGTSAKQKAIQKEETSASSKQKPIQKEESSASSEQKPVQKEESSASAKLPETPQPKPKAKQKPLKTPSRPTVEVDVVAIPKLDVVVIPKAKPKAKQKSKEKAPPTPKAKVKSKEKVPSTPKAKPKAKQKQQKKEEVFFGSPAAKKKLKKRNHQTPPRHEEMIESLRGYLAEAQALMPDPSASSSVARKTVPTPEPTPKQTRQKKQKHQQTQSPQQQQQQTPMYV